MDTHRVRRLRWRASAPGPAKAFALRALLREQGEACEAALGRAFDAAAPAGAVWRLPRLALDIRLADLQDLSAGELAARVEAAVIAALAAAGPPVHEGLGGADVKAHAAAGSDAAGPGLAAALAQAGATSHSAACEARQALRHYLSTGLLPWTLAGLAPEQAQRTLADAASEAAQAVVHGRQPLDDVLAGAGDMRARIGVLLRWLPLLSAALRRRLLAARRAPPGARHAAMAAWRAWVDDDAGDRLEWQALWLAAAGDMGALHDRVAAQCNAPSAPPFAPALREALEAMQAPAHKPGRRRAPASAKHPVSAAPAATARPSATPVQPSPPQPGPAGTGPTGSLLVPLGGLVLLHPWLPRMLAARGVLEPGGKQIAPHALPHACALLHGLAHGDAPIAEHQLPFAKLLLGREPDEPLAAALPALDADDREEIDALLCAVRDHWQALRGTGIDGLRLSFLQRRGLLSRGDGTWQLRMQAEAFDMLVAMLPWRIEQVRLPWMPTLLTVEWPTP